MLAAGCQAWAGADELGVMGLTEVRAAPAAAAAAAARDSRQRFLAARPDVFVGIDAPEFNLTLERDLKAAGIRTVQYVSPQVWAWRQGRVRTIGAAVDLVLCLLPFETDFYAAHGVRAEFVGHPLADAIPLAADRAARAACPAAARGRGAGGAPAGQPHERGVAPGARPSSRPPRHIQGKQPGWGFVAPMASPATREAFAKEIAQLPGAPAIHVIDGQAQAALAAADAVIVASGTATLETLLTGRPMVVAYKTSALTAFLLRTVGLVKVRYFSQPNLLAGRGVVPEFFQEQVSGEALGDALLQELSDRTHVAQLLEEFSSIHRTLRRGGAARAADAVLSLLAPAPGRIDARA